MCSGIQALGGAARGVRYHGYEKQKRQITCLFCSHQFSDKSYARTLFTQSFVDLIAVLGAG